MHWNRRPLRWLLFCAALFSSAAFADGRETDLRGTAMAQKLEDLLAGVASGNHGRAEVRTLVLDDRDGTVRLEADVFSQRWSLGIVRYSYRSDVSLGLDLRSGRTFDEQLTIHNRWGGASVDPDALKRIIENGLAQAIDLVPERGIFAREIRSDYERARDWFDSRHGRDNVYFATRQFVRWAGEGFAGGWVRSALAEPQDGPVELRPAAEQALREAVDVAEWLELHGQPDADAVAHELLSGQRVRWPNFTVQWQPVRYASRLFVDGRQVGGDFAVNEHAAFVLVWTGEGGSHRLVSLYRPSGPLVDESPRRLHRPRHERHPRPPRSGRRQSVELKQVSCFRTQDRVGWDEAELRIWVDGHRQETQYRSMDNGDVWDLRLRLDFEESVRIELWDRDRASGDDFIGEVHISADNLTGTEELHEGIGHYRVEWSEVEP